MADGSCRLAMASRVSEGIGAAVYRREPDYMDACRDDGWSATIPAPQFSLAALGLHWLRLRCRGPRRSAHRRPRQCRTTYARSAVRATGAFSRGNNLRALSLTFPASELF